MLLVKSKGLSKGGEKSNEAVTLKTIILKSHLEIKGYFHLRDCCKLSMYSKG